MKAIAKKSLGINTSTGLEEQISAYTIFISTLEEKIQVGYKIQSLSPTGVIVSETELKYFNRINQKEQTGIGIQGERIVVSPENNKFNQLRESEIGLAITSLIASDLDSYPDF